MARLLVSWSGGKDACLALSRVLEAGHQVEGLLTTVSYPLARVTMHGVRIELVEAQAQRLGIPLYQVLLPAPQSQYPAEGCPLSSRHQPQHGLVPDTTYEQVMLEALQPFAESGVEAVVFGDLYLQDLRRFREKLLARAGLQATFPLWGENPYKLLDEFQRQRGRAVVVCCEKDLAFLLGQHTGNGFRQALPPHVDPCGERGEFHTFVFDFALFTEPLALSSGATVERDGFLFQDLVLV